MASLDFFLFYLLKADLRTIEERLMHTCTRLCNLGIEYE